MISKSFLSANWEYLAMFNYAVDPLILTPHIPPHTLLDLFNGKALVSVVGFLFNDTKVLGVKWPGHVNFEEVNLRYYLKHFDGKTWKRGVGFISEIVPKRAISTIANLLYNEHYSCARMKHSVINNSDEINVSYSWETALKKVNKIEITALNYLQDIRIGSEEEFIFEHYYGYNKLNRSTTIEYAVKHSRWQIFPVKSYMLQCDIEKLYGKEFAPFIQDKKPQSVFLARGSAVTVGRPGKIKKSMYSL